MYYFGGLDFLLGFFGGAVCLVDVVLLFFLFLDEEIGWKTEKEYIEMTLNASPEEGENKASQEKETNRGM